MNMSNIESYLNSKGWDFKFKNGEYCLNQCPLSGCGPGHFYINQSKEIFYCQKCGEKGHLLSLKKRLGDIPAILHASEYLKVNVPSKTIELSLIEKYHKELLENPAALAYLTDQRGFSLEIIKKFRLGFNDGSITIPYFRDGLCLNVKSKPIKPSSDLKYFREEGCPSILFNLDNAKKYQGAVIITEGEFDAIAFDQMGFQNVVSVPNGAEAFSDEWIDDLEHYNQIYLSYDMDDVGRRGVEKAADKLGRYRCFNILLPLKDGNDCLKAQFTNKEMGNILVEAKPFISNTVKGPEVFFDEVLDLHQGRSVSKGVLTGWNDFDDLLSGLRPNELSVLTGETASGKTTWAANLSYKLVKKGYPVLIASFEMKPVTILKKMVQMEVGYPFFDLREIEVKAALKEISERPLYFIDVYGELGMSELRNAIYYAKRKHGIQVVVLDHLHYFLKYNSNEERQAIDQALRDMKKWTMELAIHILLIVHPTKLTYDSQVVHLNDLKGSSGLKQIPDNVFSIWRPRENKNGGAPSDNQVALHILKCRDDSGDEGITSMTFDKRSQSYL
jgi:twinkle protein